MRKQRDGGAQQRIIDAQIGGREMLKREIERKALMSEATERELREKIKALKSQKNQVREQISVQQGFVTKVANDYIQFNRLAERHICARASEDYDERMQGLGKLIAPTSWQFVPGGALPVDFDPNKDSSPIEREWRLSTGFRARRLTDVIDPIGPSGYLMRSTVAGTTRC